MANTYDVGDKVRITGTFQLNGADSDPSVVHAHYKDPSGSQTDIVYLTDAQPVKSATGVYYFDISVDEAGTWWYRMDDNDTNVATEGYFHVRATNFT